MEQSRYVDSLVTCGIHIYCIPHVTSESQLSQGGHSDQRDEKTWLSISKNLKHYPVLQLMLPSRLSIYKAKLLSASGKAVLSCMPPRHVLKLRPSITVWGCIWPWKPGLDMWSRTGWRSKVASWARWTSSPWMSHKQLREEEGSGGLPSRRMGPLSLPRGD